MTEMMPYALGSLIVLVFLLSFAAISRRSGKAGSGLEGRLLSLEKGLEELRNSLEQQATGSSEEIDSKNRLLKEEIRAGLQASIESMLKKIVENVSTHSKRLDALSSQVGELEQRLSSESGKQPVEEPSLRIRQPEQPADDAGAKAKRLARLIVSDIFLYNRKKVEEGVRNGTFYNLLEHDVREARALYERRVPQEIRDMTTYLDDAFSELVEKTKKELNL
jgi:hypothetical protein